MEVTGNIILSWSDVLDRRNLTWCVKGVNGWRWVKMYLFTTVDIVESSRWRIALSHVVQNFVSVHTLHPSNVWQIRQNLSHSQKEWGSFRLLNMRHHIYCVFSFHLHWALFYNNCKTSMSPLLGASMQGLPLRAAHTLCEKDNSSTLS